MKIKITRADGTVIEAEGTAEECERLLAAERSAQMPAFIPYIMPTLTPVAPYSPPFYYRYADATIPLNDGTWITYTAAKDWMVVS